MDPSKGGHVARHEARVKSIKRGKKKSNLGDISPKIRFVGNVREREREREREEERILRRFLGFRLLEVVEPRVKVLCLDEGYA